MALVIAVFAAMNVGVESMLRGKEEAVTLKMTEDGFPEDYIGMPAADDIPRIEDAEMWEETWATSYVTVEPTDSHRRGGKTPMGFCLYEFRQAGRSQKAGRRCQYGARYSGRVRRILSDKASG